MPLDSVKPLTIVDKAPDASMRYNAPRPGSLSLDMLPTHSRPRLSHFPSLSRTDESVEVSATSVNSPSAVRTPTRLPDATSQALALPSIGIASDNSPSTEMSSSVVPFSSMIIRRPRSKSTRPSRPVSGSQNGPSPSSVGWKSCREDRMRIVWNSMIGTMPRERSHVNTHSTDHQDLHRRERQSSPSRFGGSSRQASTPSASGVKRSVDDAGQRLALRCACSRGAHSLTTFPGVRLAAASSGLDSRLGPQRGSVVEPLRFLVVGGHAPDGARA